METRFSGSTFDTLSSGRPVPRARFPLPPPGGLSAPRSRECWRGGENKQALGWARKIGFPANRHEITQLAQIELLAHMKKVSRKTVIPRLRRRPYDCLLYTSDAADSDLV